MLNSVQPLKSQPKLLIQLFIIFFKFTFVKKSLRFYATWKRTSQSASYRDASRIHETSGFEIEIFLTHGTARSVSTLFASALAPIVLQVHCGGAETLYIAVSVHHREPRAQGIRSFLNVLQTSLPLCPEDILLIVLDSKQNFILFLKNLYFTKLFTIKTFLRREFWGEKKVNQWFTHKTCNNARDPWRTVSQKPNFINLLIIHSLIDSFIYSFILLFCCSTIQSVIIPFLCQDLSYYSVTFYFNQRKLIFLLKINESINLHFYNMKLVFTDAVSST